MRWLFAACYPLFAHLALLRGSAGLESAALIALFAAVFYAGLRRGDRATWLALAGFAAVTGGLMLADPRGYALYLPPLVFPSLALLSFADSLRPGRVPLATRIALATHPQPFPPGLERYTRAVTWAWTLVLSGVLVADTALLIFGSREAWSWWANFYGYGFIAAVFVLEYACRRYRFRGVPQAGFLDNLRSLAHARVGAGKR